jgi:serine/threonine-protein kinase ULK/ATG1
VIRTKNNLYIITEFCEGKDVGKLLRQKKVLSESEAQSIVRQIINGYRELYLHGIIHRDLKLSNLFIKNGKVKIADFGFAIPEEKCSHSFGYNVGSPYYMPPETLKYNKYSYFSDVWAMGVMTF